MKRSLLLLLFIVLSGTITAQNGFGNYPCPLSGLTSTFASRNALLIDNAGNKWVGFANTNSSGRRLLKFDGTTWTDHSSGLGTSKVFGLAQDVTGNIWIGTDNGLVMYDGVSYTTYNTSNSSLAANTVFSVICSGNTVYAGTSAGLSIYTGSAWTNFSKLNSGLCADSIYSINSEDPTHFWLGTNHGLSCYDGSATISANGLYLRINCVYTDGSGAKWIGTQNNGLYRYDNISFTNATTLYSILGAGLPANCTSISSLPGGGIIVPCAGGAATPYSVIELLPNGAYTTYYFPTTISNIQTNVILSYDASTSKLCILGKTNGLSASSKIFLYHFDPVQFSTPHGVFPAHDNLDINEVKALILDNSDLHWDLNNPQYEVPKGSGSRTLFASALWMGGRDNGGALHTAAMTYRQSGVDYWSGPLDTTNASIDSLTSGQWDKVWKVNRFDIENFKYNFLNGNVGSGTYTIPSSITSWPAHSSNPNHAKYLAPFVDYNGDGTYNPMDGDYPKMKGDQMIWWVMNDTLAPHGETHGKAMGVEIHASAYAYTCPYSADSTRVLNYTTYYNYKIFNRSAADYDSCYIGLWEDTDLGDWADDKIQCDVEHNFGFVYNGDTFDQDVPSSTGYHGYTPAFSCQVLNGPFALAGDGVDNDHNGITDEAGERILMSSFSYYDNTGNSQNGIPTYSGNGSQYYNLISGLWKDGSPIIYGNGGLGSGVTTHFIYPGTSDPTNMGTNGFAPPFVDWTENNTTGTGSSNLPGDRRFIIGCGPFHLGSGQYTEFDYALVFTQDSSCGSANTCVLARSLQDNIRVKNWFDNMSEPSCLSLSGVGIKEKTGQLSALIYPNPASSQLNIKLDRIESPKIKIEIYSTVGELVRVEQMAAYTTMKISVKELNSGFYFIKISDGQKQFTAKFVRE
ncbi:MAG: T9SS type A sorting domain-containing protein [Bacteroidia bacterium]